MCVCFISILVGVIHFSACLHSPTSMHLAHSDIAIGCQNGTISLSECSPGQKISVLHATWGLADFPSGAAAIATTQCPASTVAVSASSDNDNAVPLISGLCNNMPITVADPTCAFGVSATTMSTVTLHDTFVGTPTLYLIVVYECV